MHLRAACAWVQRALHLPDFIVGRHAHERAFATLVELMATQHAASACACPLCARRGSARARRCVSARNARASRRSNEFASKCNERGHSYIQHAGRQQQQQRQRKTPNTETPMEWQSVRKISEPANAIIEIQMLRPGTFQTCPPIHIPYSSPSPISLACGGVERVYGS